MDTVFLVLLLVTTACFGYSKLVDDEVVALQEIANKLGSRYWKFNDTSCQIEMVGMSPKLPTGANITIHCDCQNFENNECHVVSLVLKRFNLPGILPPELVKLPYLQVVDFAYNYLSGEIPSEWAALKLQWISLSVNRLSGGIPKFLGSMTSLRYLSLEANQFSGTLPAELGALTNLGTLMLSSNQLSGALPVTLAGLNNLTDFRINANNFRGAIPSFISSWKQLNRLEMHASGLMGPIPPEIFYLNNLTELRISDINGTTRGIPVLNNTAGLTILVLRNCNISGKIPPYLWKMDNLQLLDLSFNNLVGELPSSIPAKYLKVLFLTGNLLGGNVPSTILNTGLNIDLSYNNFSWQGPDQPACQANLNLNINLFRSSSAEKSLRRLLPCLETTNCPRYGCSFHVNCGGDDVIIINGDEGKVVYEGDASGESGDAVYFNNSTSSWGFSSTGDFMDDNNHQNIRYIETLTSNNLSTLYTTARVTPITLTYYGYCLENGNYTINLYFAEIRFTSNNTYTSLGKRIFDIFIQDKLVKKDFNIEDEAHGAQKPLIKKFSASVTNNTLEIRLYWAGKGTTRIPNRGVYGPLISAISVHHDSRHCSNSANKKKKYIMIGASVFMFILVSSLLLIIWRKQVVDKGRKRAGLKGDNGVEMPQGGYTLKQIKAATNNFDCVNKIGEGGFGPVYKGVLPDGTTIAVKQLSATSKQGSREFLNEIGMISCLQHPNLVELHGCCTQGDQLLLVYEYMENNNLACSLFEPEEAGCILDWRTRVKIFLGIARGLAFLHEESRLKIVHRDIKATNVLLDKDMNAKISDFGLARLGEEGKTHISTKLAGTIGYMAPEYALWGYLTNKADVYSFGILALEIVSGKSNNTFTPPEDFFCLLDWACDMQRRGEYEAIIDDKLGRDVKKDEAERMVKLALLCTNGSPSIRPTMTEVVSMLEGRLEVPEIIPEAGTFSDDMRFKAMRDVHQHQHQHQHALISSTLLTDTAVRSLPLSGSTFILH